MRGLEKSGLILTRAADGYHGVRNPPARLFKLELIHLGEMVQNGQRCWLIGPFICSFNSVIYSISARLPSRSLIRKDSLGFINSKSAHIPQCSHHN